MPPPGDPPDTSPVGIGLTAASIVIMPWVGEGRTQPDTTLAVGSRRTPGLTCADRSSVLAEGVGFEPTRSKLLAVFKTAAIGR